jgi:hypothetical protein
VAATPPVLTLPAQVAIHAGQEHCDRDSVTGAHTPALRGRGADFFDDANRLVARDERVTGEQVPGVLLVISTAEPACFDREQGVVVADLGPRKLAECQAPGRLQYGCSDERG